MPEVDRRRFLQMIGLIAAELAAANCAPTPERKVPTGIFQRGLKEVDFSQIKSFVYPNFVYKDFDLSHPYEATLNPDVMRQLVLYEAELRGQEGLVQKVEDFLDTEPLEVSIKWKANEILVPPYGQGVFRNPTVDPGEPWSAIYLNEIVLLKMVLYQQYLQSPKNGGINLGFEILPHEIEHFINYINNPEAYKPEYGTRVAPIGIGVVAGLGAAYVTDKALTRRKFLSIPVGIGVGIATNIVSRAYIEGRLSQEVHDDTPEVYRELSNKMERDDTFLKLAATSFTVTKL